MENQTKSYVVVLPTMNEEEFVFVEAEIDDLSHWEFIHSSASDSDSDSDSDPDPTVTNVISIPCPTQDVVDVDDHDDDAVDHHESSHDGYVEPHTSRFPTVVTNFITMIPGPIQDGDDDDDDDQDDRYGYDLDDELVPRALSGKFGRQRMRKLGKRGFAKNSSKKSPFAKPGCVHGKHGLGLKHCF